MAVWIFGVGRLETREIGLHGVDVSLGALAFGGLGEQFFRLIEAALASVWAWMAAFLAASFLAGMVPSERRRQPDLREHLFGRAVLLEELLALVVTSSVAACIWSLSS